MSELMLVGAKLAVVVFGSAVTIIAPASRDWPFTARVGLYFGAGHVFLTLHMLLLGLFNVRWTTTRIGLPLLLLAVVIWFIQHRADRHAVRQRSSYGPVAAIVIGLACLHLLALLVTTQATSPDYLYFWGAKALRWADARGFDPASMRDPYLIHLHNTYPPLVTAAYAWDILVAGRMFWRLELLTTFSWLLTTALVLPALLVHLGVERARATSTGALWTAVMALSLGAGFCGGNAEAPLLYFFTLALLAASSDQGTSFLAMLLAAGCVLTKTEGLALWTISLVVLAVYWTAHRTWWRIAAGAAPFAAVALWWLYELSHHLPISDPTRERAFHLTLDHALTIPLLILKNSGAGSFGLAWLLPILLLFTRKSWSAIAVQFTIIAVGIIGFYYVYYLHIAGDPGPMISFTWPRLSLAAVSAVILAIGVRDVGQLQRDQSTPDRLLEESAPSADSDVDVAVSTGSSRATTPYSPRTSTRSVPPRAPAPRRDGA